MFVGGFSHLDAAKMNVKKSHIRVQSAPLSMSNVVLNKPINEIH